MSDIISIVREELAKNVDEKTLTTGQNFFKEKIRLYGVRTQAVTQISRQVFRQVEPLPKQEIFGLCEQLWQSGYIEETFIACKWSYDIHKRYEPADFGVFERWIDLYVNNWASCDSLCNHSVGEFVEMYPEFVGRLNDFALSANRWKRRAAAVSLIIPARKGKFLDEVFAIAGLLLTDNDDLVQKGYGWMLKAASEAHRSEVFDYVVSNKSVMPRTALRYAIEKMPEEMRKEAMRK